ncbi:HK97 family phage prohead protease [Anatilimnocola floriformis]|uniref:HK97 family phage prohead protease n=1 Tax=Anatilimnocola floriformis TaxID=2948575 RepID=UPI0020C4F57E|nr:HK97 family phage prohead protease [Anatilimnocola floriformis]
MEHQRFCKLTFSVVTPAVQITQQDDGGEYFRGYAAVWFNRSNPGTTCIRGGMHYRVNRHAFDKVITSKLQIPIWYNHDDNYILDPAGEITPDDFGMAYSLRFDADDPDHAKVRAKIRKGIVQGSSWQGECAYNEYREGPYLVREIVDIDPTGRVEFSIVNSPGFKAANTGTSFSVVAD